MSSIGGGNVALCYLHPSDHVATVFHHSLMALCMRDMASSRCLLNLFPSFGGAMGLADARNKTTRVALNAGAEWVFWVDSDMGFDPDTLDRLLETADPETRPIVGGLAFAQLYESNDADSFVPRVSIAPTIYTFVPDRAVFERWSDWPRGEVVPCDATGAAMLLVHRSVFDTIAADGEGDCWFTVIPHPAGTKGAFEHFGEDVSFCLRARGNGFPIHVDTKVKTSHLKPRWLTESLYDLEAHHLPNFAVIPTKGRGGHVRDLVRELLIQGETDRVFVLDNGCHRNVVNWLDSQDRVERIEMPDAGIHDMWNRGLQAAQTVCARSNVAFLNDDVRVGPGFMSGLAGGLRARWDIAVVGPNYDGRPGEGVTLVNEICAGRYDGTGGLPGFAFMIRGESTYLFPQNMRWWYGDNDMLLYYLTRGKAAGLVLDVTVEHIDGGGQTGDWDAPDMGPVLESDRQAFHEKWGPILETVDG